MSINLKIKEAKETKNPKLFKEITKYYESKFINNVIKNHGKDYVNEAKDILPYFVEYYFDNDLKTNLSSYLYERAKNFLSIKVNFDNIINNIKILLNKNDKQITYDMSLREKDSIVQCDNLSDLNEIVKSGKVAKIHLNNTDESVHKVESYLTGGEVLGFGLEKEQGQDIITLEKVDTTAFVSRRS